MVWQEFRVGSVAAAAALVLVMLALVYLIVRVIGRRVGSLREPEVGGAWSLVIAATAKPAGLAVLGGGLYLAAQVLTQGLEETGVVEALLSGAGALAQLTAIVAVFWMVFRGIVAFEKLLQQWAVKTSSLLDDVLIPVIARALRLVLPVLLLLVLMPLYALPEVVDAFLQKLIAVFIVGAIGYLVIRIVNSIQAAVLQHNSLEGDNNLRARTIYTQIFLLRKIIVVLTVILTSGCILMLFDPVRQLGTSILASAGIAGIIIGLAAQKTLGNLLAGIQIALTQPIRIDDVVIVDGEWGRIEEITLTYVVVRIWDLRRLVVPINFFIENTFQNWTRHSANVLATVFLHVDHSMPVAAVREEFERLLRAHPLWDGECCKLHVTDCNRDTVELRCLGSAASASQAWDLRCELREKLLAFLQEKYPGHLPRIRSARVGGSQADLLPGRRVEE